MRATVKSKPIIFAGLKGLFLNVVIFSYVVLHCVKEKNIQTIFSDFKSAIMAGLLIDWTIIIIIVQLMPYYTTSAGK